LSDILRRQWGFKGHIVSDCDAVADIYQGHAIVKTEAEAARYKAGWETYVNADDLTLKPAFYNAIVAGYDASLQTKTEASAYNFFSIAEPTEGFENIFESKKPVKYMTPEGEVRIFRDGKIFNMSGALVQ
jgi:beta-glucosidase-like glycosyl hydrolase